MRELFSLDLKNYKEDGFIFRRPSARAIIIKDGRLALIHSLKYDYYKFPGGGIDKGETNEQALVREVMEEAGLAVIPESIKEFGYVCRKNKGKFSDDEIFIQENFYYTCEVEDGVSFQDLDDYEEEERFTLEYVTPEEAIEANRKSVKNQDGGKIMIERETRVLEIIKSELM